MRITLDTNQLVRALVRPPGLATFVTTAVYGMVDYLVMGDAGLTAPEVVKY
jgi:hypothetical protein